MGGVRGGPVIYCKAGQRKHLIAEEYLATHEVSTGVFLVLAAKAPASVWEVTLYRSKTRCMCLAWEFAIPVMRPGSTR